MNQRTAESRQRRTIVAVGASAGGVRALCEMASGLPADLPLAVVVVLHLPAAARSALADILDRCGPLPAAQVKSGERAEPGRIYVCVPGHHVVLDDDRLLLTDGPTENGHRPAINAMFRSVAVAAGPAGMGVMLSGVLDDGVAGLRAIRSRGGLSIVQEPEDALYPGMPQAAIAAGVVDHLVPARDIGELLKQLVNEEVDTRPLKSDPSLEVENRIAMGSRFTFPVKSEPLGLPSGYSCPDCSGSLIEVAKDTYRCYVGHAWTSDALLKAHDSDVERALWVALRTLDEKSRLSSALAERGWSATPALRSHYASAAREAEHAAGVIRERLAQFYEAQSEPGGPDEHSR